MTHKRPARGDPQAVAAWFPCTELTFPAVFCSGVRIWRGAGAAWAHWSSSPCSLMGMAAVGSGRGEGGSDWSVKASMRPGDTFLACEATCAILAWLEPFTLP